MDEGGDVTESSAVEDACVGDRCSLQLSEADWMDWEKREVGVAWSGSEVNRKAETSRATRSRGVGWFPGTVMPSSTAMRRNCWSISSSVQSRAYCKTVIL